MLAALLLLAGVQLRSMDLAVSHLNLNKRRAVVLPARRLQHSRAERVLVRVSKLVDDPPVFKVGGRGCLLHLIELLLYICTTA